MFSRMHAVCAIMQLLFGSGAFRAGRTVEDLFIAHGSFIAAR